jgi:hypothetical protein
MNVEEQIRDYVAGLPEPKRSDVQELHKVVMGLSPGCRLWFLDGKDAAGKVVSNPNIGYGAYTIKYANGSTKEFYRVGVSANSSGISVYVMGLENRKVLTETFGGTIGKASVSGYCIKFKSLKDIKFDVLISALRYGLDSRN